jgi:phosphoheptose isomerase
MIEACNQIFQKLLLSNPELASCKEAIAAAFEALVICYRQGGKVLICGNGGSAADSEHIVGELMKGFLLERKIQPEDEGKIRAVFPEDADYIVRNLQGALPAISLVGHTALSTAFINDVAADMVFAQQVYGYGKLGDILVGLSTSGNSKSVIHAIKVAKAMGIKTIGMTGQSGGALRYLCDISIPVPSAETYRIQEYHLPIYHALCAMVEAEFFGH